MLFVVIVDFLVIMVVFIVPVMIEMPRMCIIKVINTAIDFMADILKWRASDDFKSNKQATVRFTHTHTE